MRGYIIKPLVALVWVVVALVATAAAFAGTDGVFYVDTRGSDGTGDGTFTKPFASLAYACSIAPIGSKVYLRSLSLDAPTVYEASAQAVPRSNVTIATYPGDLAAGRPVAHVSGGRAVPASQWQCAAYTTHGQRGDGGARPLELWRANVTSLLGSGVDVSRVFNLWVDGARVPRVRTPLLQWAGSISEVHRGFVYNQSSFDPSWSLSAASTSQWLVVAFHQWANDVHSVASVVPSNQTIFFNEPTYHKYGFDDNAEGNRRYYIENIPELPLAAEQWRLRQDDNGSAWLDYARAPRAGRAPCSGGAGTFRAVLPAIPSLIEMTGSGIGVEDLILEHTSWLLTSPSTRATSTEPVLRRQGDEEAMLSFLEPGASLRLLFDARFPQPQHKAAAAAAPQAGRRTRRGSGPLPVPSSAITMRSVAMSHLRNVRLQHLGADGVQAHSAQNLTIVSSAFDDFGAHGLRGFFLSGVAVVNCTFSRGGTTWRQGTGIGTSSQVDMAITRSLFEYMPSDGVMLGTGHNVTISHNLFRYFGGGRPGGVHSCAGVNETISDWGAIHTAMPNMTTQSVEVHHNVIHTFASYGLGAFGLYFDYGSSGQHVHHNLVYDVAASPLYLNSNNLYVESNTTAPNVVRDNLLVAQHGCSRSDPWALRDQAFSPLLVDHNVVVWAGEAPGPGILFHDVCSGHPWQAYQQKFTDNVYFDMTNATSQFGDTWPCGQTWKLRQLAGRDQHSVIADPLFVNFAHGNFSLRAGSPALARGFSEFDHTDVGPFGFR